MPNSFTQLFGLYYYYLTRLIKKMFYTFNITQLLIIFVFIDHRTNVKKIWCIHLTQYIKKGRISLIAYENLLQISHLLDEMNKRKYKNLNTKRGNAVFIYCCQHNIILQLKSKNFLHGLAHLPDGTVINELEKKRGHVMDRQFQQELGKNRCDKRRIGHR